MSADVTPRLLHLAIGAGSCSAPGQTLAEQDGEVVNAEAPAGADHATILNASDLDAPYTLRVMHWY